MLKLKFDVYKHACIDRYGTVGGAYEFDIKRSEDYVSPLYIIFENDMGI